jgi:hypothetical protein
MFRVYSKEPVCSMYLTAYFLSSTSNLAPRRKEETTFEKQQQQRKSWPRKSDTVRALLEDGEEPMVVRHSADGVDDGEGKLALRDILAEALVVHKLCRVVCVCRFSVPRSAPPISRP